MTTAAHAAPRRRLPLPRIPWARIARTPSRVLAGMKRGAVTARSLTLHLGGLGGICTAAYGLDWRAGAAAIGVSLLVLEYLTKPEDGGRR